ncbi:hypothetical protein [Salinibaculum rarum]|uniref:hypothetical protein n=1 Tax=Salinibaculum rarum TaxID=3058903 RepID=UPI00265EEDEE|nr:hypothetical protein [Salinibaculum sp. KK48]
MQLDQTTTDTGDVLQFTVYATSDGDVYYPTALPNRFKPSGGDDLTPVDVTILDGSEIRATDETETLRYADLLNVVRVLLNDPLADLNVQHVDWTPVLHYHEQSHAAIGAEVLRRLFYESYHQENPDIFSASVNGISFEVSDQDIYPQIGTDAEAPIHAFQQTAKQLFSDLSPSNTITKDLIDPPNFRANWAEPAFTLHPHSPRILEQLLTVGSPDFQEIVAEVPGVSTRNEVGIHHLGLLLCFHNEFDVLTPRQRDELLAANHPVVEYVRSSTPINLSEESDIVRFREKHDSTVLERLYQQRILQQWKSEANYQFDLAKGDTVVVHAPNARQWLAVQLDAQRAFDGYEELMEPLWFGTVQQISGYQEITNSVFSDHQPAPGSEFSSTPRPDATEDNQPGTVVPVFSSHLYSATPDPNAPFTDIDTGIADNLPDEI